MLCNDTPIHFLLVFILLRTQTQLYTAKKHGTHIVIQRHLTNVGHDCLNKQRCAVKHGAIV